MGSCMLKYLSLFAKLHVYLIFQKLMHILFHLFI